MMQLLEVKNDIAKIKYNPADNKLLPSDFLLIDDSNQKLVGQILSIYTTEESTNNFADVRLALYIDKDEKLSYYNGYIPPRTSKVMYITADEITEMIADSETNIYLGCLTYHQKSIVKTPMSLVNERLYIQCDREDNRKIIMQNLVSEIYMKQRKIILLDFDGRYNRISNVPRLTISESFKFPLNSDAFDIILEYDTKDCPIEDRAVIQSIVLELKDYIRTLENKFLPFTLFKNVVVSEFSANPLSGLMLLRNKLWQYAQEGLFAESKSDFDIINRVMENENIVIVDASKIEDKWHKFAIQTIPKILNKHCYFAFSMNDVAMDKRSIISLYNDSNIVPIVSTSYDSQYRPILKSLCKNQILFKPSKQTEVDEQYGALIHKLNSNDFILYGEASLNLPLIIELKPFDVQTSEKIAEQEIRRDVDKILSTGKSMLPKEAVLSDSAPLNPVSSGKYTVDEDFTEEDLDFVDNIAPEKITIDDIKNRPIAEEKQAVYDLFEPFVQTLKEEEKGQDSDYTIVEEEEERETEENSDFVEGTVIEENEIVEEPVTDSTEAILNEVSETNETSTQSIEEEVKPIEHKTELELDEVTEPEHKTELKNEPTLELDSVPYENAEEELKNKDDSPVEEIKISEDVVVQENKIDDDILVNETQNETETLIEQEIPIENDININDNKSNDDIQVEKIIDPIEEKVEQVIEQTENIQKEILQKDEEALENVFDETEEDVSKEEPVIEQEVQNDNVNKPSQVEQLKLVEEKPKEEEIVPISNVIENIKIKAKNTANKLKQAKEERAKKKAEKNTPPQPTKTVNNHSFKKELTVYETDNSSDIINENNLPFKVGDRVYHPKHGKGVVEGFANYSNKILFCQIEFENVGRRILDPRISGIEKID